MAIEKKMDVVILGLLRHEELSGYEIKKRMDTTLHYFWGASYGSIYPTLRHLVEQGLATKRVEEESKRNKILYAITSKGRIVLKEWLKQPVEKDELRYETLLKLFFGQDAGGQCALSHIEEFQAKIEMELTTLMRSKQVLETHLNEDPAHTYYLLTVQFGIMSYQTYLHWCEEAKKQLKLEGERS